MSHHSITQSLAGSHVWGYNLHRSMYLCLRLATLYHSKNNNILTHIISQYPIIPINMPPKMAEEPGDTKKTQRRTTAGKRKATAMKQRTKRRKLKAQLKTSSFATADLTKGRTRMGKPSTRKRGRKLTRMPSATARFASLAMISTRTRRKICRNSAVGVSGLAAATSRARVGGLEIEKHQSCCPSEEG